MKNLIVFPLALLLLVGFRADRPKDPEREERKLAAFDAISVGDAITVIVHYGPQKVEVEADPDLMANIKTTVENRVLHIENEGHNKQEKPRVKILIDAERLSAIDAYGGAKVEFKDELSSGDFRVGFSGASRGKLKLACRGNIDIDCSGASILSLYGKADNAVVDLSGASQLKADDFVLGDAVLNVSGAAEADINVNGHLNVEASGAGRVSYKGKPTDISRSLSGGASLKAGK